MQSLSTDLAPSQRAANFTDTTGKTNILLFGATGYVGGALLSRLLKRPKADTFEIVTPIRALSKAKVLEKLGAKREVASLSEHDKIAALASQADVIFNLANADNVPAMKAVLRGMRTAHETTGQLPVLIHTACSGTGEIIEFANGEYATDTVYSDLNIEQMKSIPPEAHHRNVDLAVIGADEEGYARTYLISPGMVYGIASALIHDAGIAKRFSIQIPGLVKPALARRRGGMVGPGKAVWPHAHVDDVADMSITLFDAISKNPQSVGHGWEGYYFVENGHVSRYEIGKAIGQALVDLGLAKDAEPTSFTNEELENYWASVSTGSFLSGTTCRTRADRARSIGWKSQSADVLATVKPESSCSGRWRRRKARLTSHLRGALPSCELNSDMSTAVRGVQKR
ncbi:NAD(P)-binding protein [Fomitopsis serialis]|uniref:NAD(P)-binding protein n=1 Tax=Fomitopsis serialis TaxID=139415 RepID=UPI0020084AC4|nr:NAD(P)-binding protein [Neoantrodia serialis]KAH9930926.1 NAD(P)-binding protein [Neoantrodia serialis]